MTARPPKPAPADGVCANGRHRSLPALELQGLVDEVIEEREPTGGAGPTYFAWPNLTRTWKG